MDHVATRVASTLMKSQSLPCASVFFESVLLMGTGKGTDGWGTLDYVMTSSTKIEEKVHILGRWEPKLEIFVSEDAC